MERALASGGPVLVRCRGDVVAVLEMRVRKIMADWRRFNAALSFWEAGARPRIKLGPRYRSGLTRWLERVLEQVERGC